MISNELIIQRCGQGIRLADPNPHTAVDHVASVFNIMRMPMNFYFMDRGSHMIKMNDVTALTCGYLSAEDGVGKSLRDVGKCASTEQILANDREVMHTLSCKVSTESYTRHDDIELTAISIKYPWLQNNQAIGVFGCSILLGYAGAPSLHDALSALMQTGLLMTHIDQTSKLPGWDFNGVYFDQRDKDILYLLVRGKTAKNIAKQMGLSHRTIEHRLESIKHKLGTSSKSELIERIVDQFIVVPQAEGS